MLEVHRELLLDEVRTNAYRDATRSVVTAGSVVLDLGLGHSPARPQILVNLGCGNSVLSHGDGTIDIGSGLIPCDYGRLAWVSVPGVHTVDVCGSFSGLSTGMGGVTLIHEMLHTLGLPEGPPDYTSDQIQQMVSDWCGTQ